MPVDRCRLECFYKCQKKNNWVFLHKQSVRLWFTFIILWAFVKPSTPVEIWDSLYYNPVCAWNGPGGGVTCLCRVGMYAWRHDVSWARMEKGEGRCGGKMPLIQRFQFFFFKFVTRWRWRFWRVFVWLTIWSLIFFLFVRQSWSVRCGATAPELKSEAVCFQNGLWSVIFLWYQI